MARPTSKSDLLEEIACERKKLEGLLAAIPADRKLEEVTDGMSVKDPGGRAHTIALHPVAAGG